MNDDFAAQVPQFGSTATEGVPFQWSVQTDHGPEVINARTVADIAYQDSVRYSTRRHAGVVAALHSIEEARAAYATMKDDDGFSVDKYNEIIDDRIDDAQANWEAKIDTILMLVNPADRSRLRQPLIDSNPVHVDALADWLEKQVLGQAIREAGAAANVDPTSRPAQAGSASNPASGGGSASEGSPSTD